MDEHDVLTLRRDIEAVKETNRRHTKEITTTLVDTSRDMRDLAQKAVAASETAASLADVQAIVRSAMRGVVAIADSLVDEASVPGLIERGLYEEIRPEIAALFDEIVREGK